MKKLYFFVLFLLIGFQGRSQIINFVDPNFKAALIAPINTTTAYDNLGNPILIDTNGNGEIELSEAANPNIDIIYISNLNLTNISGIENFINIKRLDCSHNLLTSLNVQSMVNLVALYCENNQLTTLLVNGLANLDSISCQENALNTIDVSQCSVLRYLRIYDNQLVDLNLNGLTHLNGVQAGNNHLTSIEFAGAFNLWDINVRNNFLTTLDVTNLSNLVGLECAFNQLTSLKVSGLSEMTGLSCEYNLLENIDLSGLSSLNSFTCNNNAFMSLDLSGCTSLFAIECQNNQLKYLNIKNGAQELNIYFSGNPNLEFICADENQLPVIESLLFINGNTLCNFNAYCSFTPGGNYYTIQGNQKFDSNINGCDTNDVVFPNLNFNITDGTVSGNIISNSSGNYSIFVGQGTHTITPIVENPTYFTISPSNFQVNFPTQTSPYNENFCITPNGSHKDLGVVIIPLIPARPGFDATYKIVFKNKGTITLSGSVTFNFEDDKMDFVSSTPTFTSQSTNVLVFDYSNLTPLESREIIITMNINSPMETPAVTIGDQLNFTANISPSIDDEFLPDNFMGIKQIVVGSYDPNDKTCIEGDVVGPEIIGNYIHYVIRFENTGTFPAENVVIKDIIDESKFDVSSLKPLSSSHDFVTRITSSNQVEFIFENINLPFDDATNDGYVAFKIKTLPTLVVGDTFTNNASIYFDYNFPIVTNTASTLIQTLGNQEFDLSRYITFYPSPAQDVLNINAKSDIVLSSIQVYNTLGQLVIVIPSAQGVEAINVSSLKTGNYFIKVVSDKGIANTQFIKE